MWQYGDVIAWREIDDYRLWHVQASIVIRETPAEIVVAFIPGSEGFAEKSYAEGRGKKGNRRWDFKYKDWELVPLAWHTNRMLAIVQPEKYYSIMCFWNHEHHDFLGYYVNFQLPFIRSHCGIDTLDLDLDIDIEPDLNFRWKDEDDYQKAIDHGLISQEWIQEIERTKPEILHQLESRQYPFDGTWLNWMPDPGWSPPKLPDGWDKI